LLAGSLVETLRKTIDLKGLGVSPDGSLLERDGALEAMLEAMRSVELGDGAVVFLAGTAGIGKTSLLGAARRAAQAAGFTIASAVGSPMETGLPFGLLGQAIVALGGSEVDDPVELVRLGGQSARFYRVFRWLADVAGASPLVLALDDLHWSDPDSLELLGFLCRRLTGVPIVVLGALRPEPDPATALAHELVGSGHARMVVLEPLSREASVALVEGKLSRPLDRSESDWAWRACVGTPLLLEAAASALARAASPALECRDGSGPRLLLERFVGMDVEAFGYVQAASIFGVRFRPRLAAALGCLEESAARAAHARLVRARLLKDLPEGWTAFAHPLFAQSLLDTQSLSERERAHAAAFRLLLAAGEPDALAAEHAVSARLVGDPLAVDVCSRAGLAAMAQGALAVAVAHLANAVELAGEDASVELLLDYDSALAARAQFEEAEQVCVTLLARTDLDPAARARSLALLARTAMVASRPADAERLYEQAAAAARLAGSDLEAATLADAAVTCQMSSPVSWVSAITDRALALAQADTSARSSLEVLAAYALLLNGDPSGAELILGESRRWAERAGGDRTWVWTLAVHLLNTLKILTVVEDLAGATELFEREFERAIEEGSPILISGLAIAYADAADRLGRPREALELVRRALELSDWPMPPWSDLALAVLLNELGRDEDARRHIEALRAFQVGVTPQYHAPVSLWLALLDARGLLAAGEPEKASREMLRAAEVAERSGWRHPCFVPWAGVGLDAHFAAGRLDRVRALIEDLDELSRPLSSRWPRAVLALGRARLAAAEGEAERAEHLFAEALDLFAELPMPIAQAEALIVHGVHLRRGGHQRQAREPLARALALAEECGAERVAREARAELAAAGGRRRRREEDPNKLTSQEARVTALAAEGLTNAQIAAAVHLSAKTVGHHLQHAYSKLGIRSRRELIKRGRQMP